MKKFHRLAKSGHVLGILFFALAILFVSVTEFTPKTFTPLKTSISGQSNNDVIKNKESPPEKESYYEYPYIKEKYHDGAILKETDWGEAARDVWVEYLNYWNDYEIKIVDVAPEGPHVRGSMLHFGEVYNEDHYIGRVVSDTAEEGQEIHNLHFYYDNELLQKLFSSSTITALDVDKQPKFIEWQSRKLVYEVTFVLSATGESHRVEFRSVGMHTPGQVSFLVPSHTSYVTDRPPEPIVLEPTFLPDEKTDILQVDAALGGSIITSFDLTDVFTEYQNLATKHANHFANHQTSPHIKVQVNLLKEASKGSEHICSMGNYSLLEISSTKQLNIGMSFVNNDNDCSNKLLLAANRTSLEKYVFEITLLPRSHKRLTDTAAEAFFTTKPFTVGNYATLFDDQRYYEQTGERYILNKPIKGLPGNKFLSQIDGVYQYNFSTKEYIKLAALPEDLSIMTAPLNTVYLEEHGSYLYLINGPYEGRQLMPLVYLNVFNPVAGLVETSYLIDVWSPVSPDETKVVATVVDNPDKLVVFDFTTATAKTVYTAPPDLSLYNLSAYGDSSVMVKWINNYQIEVELRHSTAIDEGVVVSNNGNQILETIVVDI